MASKKMLSVHKIHQRFGVNFILWACIVENSQITLWSLSLKLLHDHGYKNLPPIFTPFKQVGFRI